MSDYKTHLFKLNMLPLMYYYDLSDILFFIKSIKSPFSYFDINKYVTFCNHSTRSAVKTTKSNISSAVPTNRKTTTLLDYLGLAMLYLP